MAELKTLKDLQRRGNEENYSPEEFVNSNVVSVKELKREAIKWIQSYDDAVIDDGVFSVIKFIKTFFNITEEDLDGKEKES